MRQHKMQDSSLKSFAKLKAPSLPLFLFQGHAPDQSPEQAPGPRKKLKAKS